LKKEVVDQTKKLATKNVPVKKVVNIDLLSEIESKQ